MTKLCRICQRKLTDSYYGHFCKKCRTRDEQGYSPYQRLLMRQHAIVQEINTQYIRTLHTAAKQTLAPLKEQLHVLKKEHHDAWLRWLNARKQLKRAKARFRYAPDKHGADLHERTAEFNMASEYYHSLPGRITAIQEEIKPLGVKSVLGYYEKQYKKRQEEWRQGEIEYYGDKRKWAYKQTGGEN